MNKKLPFENLISSTGYNFAEEIQRYQFSDIKIDSIILNRGLCKAGVSSMESHPDWSIMSCSEVFKTLFPNTLRRQAPIVDISRPVVGHYFSTNKGIFFDAYLGVGQKLIDDNHPNLRDMVHRLMKYNALLRREISTNDFIVSNPR